MMIMRTLIDMTDELALAVPQSWLHSSIPHDPGILAATNPVNSGIETLSVK